MKEMDAASRKRKMYPNIKHFIKENLYEIKLPKPETVVKGGKIKYKIYKGTEKQIDKIDKQNQSKIEELKQEIEKLKEKKRLEKWFLEKKKKSNKFSKYKKYFKSKTLNLAAFNRNLPKYYRIFNDYKNWRKSFKYPEITYLQKVHNIKPLPPDNLIKDLANSISEIKKLYLGLKDFKAVIIFKLFIHHISQCIKAKCKIKYHSKGYNWGGSVSPVERDIDEIGNLITEFYLYIKDADDDPNTKEFSCLCGKLKGKKNIGVLCKNKECHTEVSACQPKPWNSAPNFVSIKAKEKYIDGKDYKKYLREYKRLLKIKNKNQIQTKKYVFGKGTYKVSVVEDLADNFFKLTYHLDDEKLNFIFNQIPNKIDKKFDDKRIILNKSDKDLEL